MLSTPRATTAVDQALPSLVGTPAWFRWLTTVTQFHLVTTVPARRFGVRQEGTGRSRAWYLYADAPSASHPRRLLLGSSAHLTRAHLAATLARLLPDVPATITLPDFAPAVAQDPLFPLLVTKLQRPTPRAPILAVPAAAQLEAALTVPVTLVSAPGGAGKTTLVAHWLATASHPTAWVALDARDTDPLRLWTYLVAALDGLVPGLLQDVQPFLHQAPQTWMARVLNRCHSLTTPVVLVLDESQHLATASPSVLAGLAFLLDHLPSALHVVLLCRQPPALPFARWRSQGRLLEIPGAALHLPRAEAARWLNAQGIVLTAAEVRHLNQHLTGWVSGWQLVVAALRRAADRSQWLAAFPGTRTISAYFAEEILAGVPTATQTFLLQTSLLDQLTASACDALLATVGSQAQLDALEQAQLFVTTRDDHRQIFVLHPLFRHFLRERLSRQPLAEVHALAARALAWSTTQKTWEVALRAAALTGQMDMVAQTLAAASPTLLAQGHLDIVQHWLQQLPAAILATQPHLLVLAAYCAQRHRQPVTPAPLRAVVAHLRTRVAPAERQLLTGELRAYHALRLAMQGATDTSLHVYQHTCAQLGSDHPVVAVLQRDLGRVYQQQGQGVAAQQVLTALYHGTAYPSWRSASARVLALLAFVHGPFDQILAYCRAGQVADGSARAEETAVLQALTLYERNDLVAAHAALQDCLAIRPPLRITALALGIAALIAAAQGDGERAHQLITQALARAAAAGPMVTARVVFLAVRIALLCAQPDSAFASWELVPDVRSVPVLESYRPIVQARLAVQRGEPQAALASLAVVEPTLQQAGYRRHLLDARLTAALAYQLLGQSAAARHVLREALVLAAPAGWVRPFLDSGEPLHPLIAAVVEGSSPFARALRAGALTTTTTVPRDPQSTEASAPGVLAFPLTARERTILHHIMRGASNGELAQALSISVGTVKRHVSNIFLKLGVKSRTQALAQALALHLILEER